MRRGILVAVGLGLGLLSPALALDWVGDARARLEAPTGPAPLAVATAAPAHAGYCSPELQQVLRRVLQSCGLSSDGTVKSGRGCQPADAKTVATMSGDDFNALFLPMSERAAIVQFDQSEAALDPDDRALVDRTFADRRGASWFFVVARASPEGDVRFNRELSRKRAEAVMAHLATTFEDPDLEKQVGLLWLGEEYAQLDVDRFCAWSRSGDDGACDATDLNRSAFLAWIDCRL